VLVLVLVLVLPNLSPKPVTKPDACNAFRIDLACERRNESIHP
jgi:hypothetical protein